MLDSLRDLFLAALFHKESEQILVKRWNEEISRLQDVFDRLTDKVSVSNLRPVVLCKDCDLWNRWDKTGRESLGNFRCSCAGWSGEGYTVYTAPYDYCSYGERIDGCENMEKLKKKKYYK